MKILLVDDDVNSVVLLKDYLEEMGWKVLEAATAAAASVLLNEERPTLVIVDYTLPDAKGSEVVRKAKRHLPSVKSIMLTGLEKESVEELLRGEDVAVDAILTKPVSLVSLADTIRRLDGEL